MIKLLLQKVLFGFFFLSFHFSKAQDLYEVTINKVSERVVNIKAKLFPKSDSLLMSPFGATHLKNGWATFVTNLSATNNNGEKINLRELENGLFIIPSENKGIPINLSYQVSIVHDQGKWPFGYKEAAYVKNDMLMTTGNALFITRMDMDSALILFG